MTRVTLMSALVLAMAASSGCGAPPTSEDLASKYAPPPNGGPARLAGSETRAAPQAVPLNQGFSFVQANVLADLSAGGDASVRVEQSNQVATVLLDDPLDLLEHYAEVRDQLVWDRTTRAFYVTQANLRAGVYSYSEAVLRQINRLIIIVDRNATHYSGTVVQLNVIDGFTVEQGGQTAIAQVNNVTVIHPDGDGPDAEDFVAAMRTAPGGTPGPMTGADVLSQGHELIIYIDGRGRPHLYRWQPPTGKYGMGDRRRG